MSIDVVKMGKTDVSKILLEVARNYASFGEENWRETAAESPHKDTEAIYLREPAGELSPEVVFNEVQARDTIWIEDYPVTQELILDIMTQVRGVQLGRVVLISLKPGGEITPHVDEGIYPAYYDGYHVCLQADGCEMLVGTTKVYPQPGDIFWINNSEAEHSVVNGGAKERIHLVIDIKSFGGY